MAPRHSAAASRRSKSSDGAYGTSVRKATETGTGTQEDGGGADATSDAGTEQPPQPSNQAGPLGGLGDTPQVPEADTGPVVAPEEEEQGPCAAPRD